MQHRTRSTIVATLVVASLILQPILFTMQLMQSAPAWLQPFAGPIARAQQTGGSIYLPLVANGTGKPNPPAFAITTPTAGGAVSGMIFFAIQALDSAPITSVTFKAGDTVLGADNTATDGFKIFANASSLPAGVAQFSAIATGPGGSTTQSVAVSVVPNPPANATIGASGGVLASQTGSVISILPGSVPDGTAITVTELTQDEVTAKHGIQWDNIGVTFLGQQDIQSSAPFSLPLGSVSSAGFGNRVQPGQAVVNYRILPDADGDGADEIVVVNTASVAPNGAVVADPVNTISIANVTIQSQLFSEMQQSQRSEISGPPGTIVTISTTGLNPNSIQGNIARFQSLVDGKIFESPVVVIPDSVDPKVQSVTLVIPPLSIGSAKLMLRNEGTSETSNSINVTIKPLGTLPKAANQILHEFFIDSIQFFKTLPASQISEIYRQQVVSSLTNSQSLFTQLYAEPNAAVQNFLYESAAIVYPVHNSLHLYQQVGASAIDLTQRQIVTGIAVVAGVVGAGAAVLAIPAVGAALGISAATLGIIAAAGAVIRFGAQIAGAIAFGMWLQESDGNNRQCEPAQNGSSGPTGMGSALPSGGNGCGNTSGSAIALVQVSASSQVAQSTQVAVKIYVNGKATPFTGMTDPGGYFFIPLIPQNEPFTAIAFDRTTGETRSFRGVGPQIGKSVFMFFDFFNAEPPSIRWDGGGDGTSWADAQNWDTDKTPVAADRVAIDAPVNTKITISQGNVEIVSLHNAASLQISGSSLTINGNSVISGSLIITNSAALTVKEVAAALTVGGDLTMSNSALRAIGLNSKVEVRGNVALYRADLNATNGSKILLPTAQQYNAGSGGIGTGVIINATGAGSRIDLSKVTSLLGDTSWGGDLVVQAINGGQVDLQSTSVLTTGNMKVTADGAGSQVNLTGLQRLDSTPGFQGGNSLLAVKNGGTILVPNLARLSQVDLNLNAGSTLATSQMISYTTGQATFTGMVVDMNNITTLDNVNFILKSGGNVRLNGLTQMRRVGLDVNDGVTFVALNLKRYDASSGAIASGVTFKATGTGSRIDLSAVTTLLGDVGWGGGFAVKAINGGQIDLRNSTSLITGTMSVLADGVNSTVDLSSLIEFRATPGFQGDQAALEVRKDGTINLNANGLTLQKVVVLVSAGGALNCGALDLAVAAKLAGDGVIPCAITNQGEVAPGFSPATLSLTKSYAQTSAGALTIEIGGTSAGSFDTMAISGAATLAGTLNIALINDFQPNIGDSFTILGASSVAGTFATIDGSAIGNGKKFQVQYGASSVTLQVVPQ